MTDGIEIDGSQGEGGGQILRSALALSMVTGQPLRLTHIRARRPKPGLMRQHLACVRAAQAVSNAQVEGAALGSPSLSFAPGAVQPGSYRFEVGSAGSTGLVLQTVLPALMCAHAPSQLQLLGGTHNPLAPPFHFLQRAYAPLLQRLGVGLALRLRRHGFYPAGGGDIQADICPAAPGQLQPFDLLERGALQQVQAEALSAGVARHVAPRELSTLGQALGWPDPVLLTPALRSNEGPGNVLIATLTHAHVTELFCSFGNPSHRAEAVALQLAQQVQAWLNSPGAVGSHLADQLALPLALAVWQQGRPARYRCTDISDHTRSHLAVIERFLPLRSHISPVPDGAWEVGLALR